MKPVTMTAMAFTLALAFFVAHSNSATIPPAAPVPAFRDGRAIVVSQHSDEKKILEVVETQAAGVAKTIKRQLELMDGKLDAISERIEILANADLKITALLEQQQQQQPYNLEPYNWGGGIMSDTPVEASFPAPEDLKRELDGVMYEILADQSIKRFVHMEYANAKHACQKAGGSMLTIKSEKETEFIKTWLFGALKLDEKLWIDLVRVNGTNDFLRGDGQLVVTNSTTQHGDGGVYKNWHKCEPNDITINQWSQPEWGENCVEMYAPSYPYPLRCNVNAMAGQWNDIPCTNIYNLVVCELNHGKLRF